MISSAVPAKLSVIIRTVPYLLEILPSIDLSCPALPIAVYSTSDIIPTCAEQELP